MAPVSRKFPEGTPSRVMLRSFRKDAGFTVCELAKALGLAFQCVKNWEAGRSRPRDLDSVFTVLCLSTDERVALSEAVEAERKAIRNR